MYIYKYIYIYKNKILAILAQTAMFAKCASPQMMQFLVCPSGLKAGVGRWLWERSLFPKGGWEVCHSSPPAA